LLKEKKTKPERILDRAEIELARDLKVFFAGSSESDARENCVAS
jgi:hypothetical protein